MKSILYQTLLEKGVPDSHINKMRETNNISEEPYRIYYDEISEEEKTYRHVPLSKVKSLGYRGTSGLSWFDHACYNGTDNIDIGRCHRAYKYLEEQSLEEFQAYYKRSAVKLIHFEDDDFYAVYGDGTHRTLWAKVTGAPTIYAVVTKAKKNHERYHAYRWFKVMEKDFNTYLKNHKLDWGEDCSGSLSEIVYQGRSIGYHSLYSPRSFSWKYDFTNEKLNDWKVQQQQFKEDISKSLQSKKEFQIIMRFTPQKLKSKLLSFFDYRRDHWMFSDEGRLKFKQIGFDMFCIDQKNITS
ncbi:hypothetical protein COE55_17915 [Priestia megaterium]|uniref:hypothetical protein n=1 Tax=Priestia megaterium TaxID=1404 RepID=UPI000BFBF1E0|nr:hypothetical protein [Priestia megaterium]PGZ77316.1 hypothetical protein COE55_17915 [Priestia megaterium]